MTKKTTTRNCSQRFSCLETIQIKIPTVAGAAPLSILKYSRWPPNTSVFLKIGHISVHIRHTSMTLVSRCMFWGSRNHMQAVKTLYGLALYPNQRWLPIWLPIQTIKRQIIDHSFFTFACMIFIFMFSCLDTFQMKIPSVAGSAPLSILKYSRWPPNMSVFIKIGHISVNIRHTSMICLNVCFGGFWNHMEAVKTLYGLAIYPNQRWQQKWLPIQTIKGQIIDHSFFSFACMIFIFMFSCLETFQMKIPSVAGSAPLSNLEIFKMASKYVCFY